MYKKEDTSNTLDEIWRFPIEQFSLSTKRAKFSGTRLNIYQEAQVKEGVFGKPWVRGCDLKTRAHSLLERETRQWQVGVKLWDTKFYQTQLRHFF